MCRIGIGGTGSPAGSDDSSTSPGTVRTGHGLSLITRSALLPTSPCSNFVLPCVPRTIISDPHSFALRVIRSLGMPTSLTDHRVQSAPDHLMMNDLQALGSFLADLIDERQA